MLCYSLRTTRFMEIFLASRHRLYCAPEVTTNAVVPLRAPLR